MGENKKDVKPLVMGRDGYRDTESYRTLQTLTRKEICKSIIPHQRIYTIIKFLYLLPHPSVRETNLALVKG